MSDILFIKKYTDSDINLGKAKYKITQFYPDPSAGSLPFGGFHPDQKRLRIRKGTGCDRL
ncbi:hypothetical protein [Laspinema olomoucense]|uniref:hypothetical protein n=1 Tax=Laspinema olomoucense TaxID=3231600 RepID=UPI0021BAD013|nr:hypothetical protein [Laspinema sp. D3d]MCT7972188.1 hypothetical protein [Laspinema sp. D3d]MCT7990483.1 hypothetical protein [Laspinema sp. D3a]